MDWPLRRLTRINFSEKKHGILFPCFLYSIILFSFVIIFRNLIPINNIPESFDVFWTSVLVFQVISMLPNIQSEKWFFPSIIGLSWFGVLIISISPLSSTSHAHPDPKRPVAA